MTSWKEPYTDELNNCFDEVIWMLKLLLSIRVFVLCLL